MRLEIHVHVHQDPALLALWESINHKVGHIMTKVSELEGRLTTVNTELGKIGNETTKTLQLVEDLKAQLADADLPAGAESALAALEEQVKRVDDMVPDPVEPPSDTGSGTSTG